MLPAEPASHGCGKCPTGMSAKWFVSCNRLGHQDEGGDGEDKAELVRRYQEGLGLLGHGHVTTLPISNVTEALETRPWTASAASSEKHFLCIFLWTKVS